MCNLQVISIFLILCVIFCRSSDIFHENSKIPCFPTNLEDFVPKYFGYTVVLTNTSLLVGAPKATRIKGNLTSGAVYKCEFTKNELDFEAVALSCKPMVIEETERPAPRLIRVKGFFRQDMWFGATISTVPEGKLLICAPRWADPYSDKHLLATGACYMETTRYGNTLLPLKDNYNLAFKTDGVRKEYGEYGTHLNFYAYGQAGMSLKVTENNSIIIGAPGLLQWTGGVVDYKFSTHPSNTYVFKMPTTNPYYTKELGPDDYFGYSVESGIFETNGTVLYVAGAPRSSMGYGQVLIFEPARRAMDPLRIHVRVRGPQLGSYFGASLCCTDLNGDGRADLLVGAPNYVNKALDMPHDQGAVFVYLAAGNSGTFELQQAGFVSGSGESGARFGSTIAALGDVNGDGYIDIAVGAPWEKNGAGAVYIYRGSARGLEEKYSQRITVEDSGGFGMSISRAVDVDGNNCKDLAIGAHNTAMAYIFRCVPSIKVRASIKVPDAMNLPKNTTNFSALFCVSVLPAKSWPHVKIDLQATITIDPEGDRASVDDSQFTITAAPGKDVCEEQVVEVKPTADLSKPILMVLDLKPKEPTIDQAKHFKRDAARLSEDSTLHTSFLLQLIRDCGDDLICIPFLEMKFEALDSEYVPGSNDTLGIRLTIQNKEEPAYGAKVLLSLPLPPIRVPGSCSLVDQNMTCDLPNPLGRGEFVEWEIELDYSSKAAKETLNFKAELRLPVNSRNSSEETVKYVTIDVVPKADFSVVGNVLPNKTVAISREKFDEAENITFVHYFQITNLGPSDWFHLEATIDLPKNISLSVPVSGCEYSSFHLSRLRCAWALPAKQLLSLSLSLRYDLGEFGEFLEQQTSENFTTTVTLLLQDQQRMSVTTTLTLDPAPPLWPIILGLVAGCVGGLLLLAAIVYGLYRFGFFSRTKREELKKLIEESPSELGGVSTSGPCHDESTDELLSDDSDSN